ncbi:MAG: hypothetical protein HYT89_01395 [Candidatus Omnitrophica bacterium]|nr:hypothetical protein [Candidatus Omnitrophota bacterium]
MPKDKTPKPGPEYSKEREWRAVLEELQGQFRVFGDGLSDLQDKVGQLQTDISTLKEDTSLIKTAIPTLATKKDLGALEKRLTTLESAR